MSAAIVIIDTSVFVEILDLPGFAGDAASIRDELEEWIRSNAALLLPIAVVIETGNHIAQLNDGRSRRQAAETFVNIVMDALDGNSPFAPTPSFDNDELRQWLPSFVNRATEGIGLADTSLIELWERERTLSPARRVLIWSLDGDLAGYDTGSQS